MKNSAFIFCFSVLLGLAGCGDADPAGAAPNDIPKKPESTHAQDGKEKAHGKHDEKYEHGEEKAGSHEGHDEHGEEGHGEEGHEEGHEEAHEEGLIKLTPEQIKNAGIGFATAGKAPLRQTLPLYGVIAPNAERVRDVSARFPGTIRQLDIKVGDTVRQGDTLATVESNESLQVYAVKAPLSGVVTTRNANAGEQTGDKVLFSVADFSSVWVELALFPRDASQVRTGQPVRVKSTDGGVTGEGTIVYVSPFGTSSNQTLTARVILDNTQHRWTPGLYVSADVALSETPVALAISNEAVQTVEGRSVVFVKELEGFEARPVRLGRSDGINSEVLEGIDAGATYVAVNSFVLKAELTKGEAEHEH